MKYDNGIEILNKKVKEMSKEEEYYDLKDVDLIPLEEPVSISCVVLERTSTVHQTDNLPHKASLKISAEEDLSLAYNLYLSSSSYCGLLLPGT